MAVLQLVEQREAGLHLLQPRRVGFEGLAIATDLRARVMGLLGQRLQAPGEPLQAGIEIGGATDRHRGLRQASIGVQAFLRGGDRGQEPRRVAKAIALHAEVVVLPRARVDLAQAAQAPQVELLLLASPGRGLAEARQAHPRRLPAPVRRRDLVPLGERTGEGVEQPRLSLRLCQPLLVVLPVDGHARSAPLRQLGDRDRGAVDGGATPGADRAPQRQGPPGPFEASLHQRLRSALPDLPGLGARAQRQAERVDQQRLAASRLAAEESQARPQLERAVVDQCQVADGQARKHHRSPPMTSLSPSLRRTVGTSGRPHPSFIRSSV